MQIKTLYRFIRPNGGVTVSLTKPDCEYTEKVRLIADEGKVLTDGETVTPCVDTDTPDEWTEIDAPPDDIPEENETTDEPDTDTTTYAELAQVYREGVDSIE